MSGTGPTEKFVQNAGLLRAVQAELCSCLLKFDLHFATSVEYKSKEWLIL